MVCTIVKIYGKTLMCSVNIPKEGENNGNFELYNDD